MNLAISYYEGEGVEQDKEKAVQLLTEAAEYMPDAQFLHSVYVPSKKPSVPFDLE